MLITTDGGTMVGVRSKHDEFFRHMMTYTEVAYDFFETRLPADVLALINLDTLKLENTTLVDTRLNKHESDILYSVKRVDNEKAFLYILSEHQSESDPLMPFRLHYYMIQFLKRHIVQNKETPLPLPFIYAMVIYNGKTIWSHDRDFFNLFGNMADLARKTFTEPCAILDVGRMDESELRKQHLSNVMLASLRRTKDIKELERKANLLGNLLLSCYIKASSDMGHAVLEYATSTIPWDSEESVTYWAILKEGFSPEYEEVIMNLKQGTFNMGIRQGIQQGIQQTAINMIHLNIALESISKATGLSIEELKRLEEENKQYQ